MNEQSYTVEVISSDTTYSITEICYLCQIDANDLPAFLEYGIIVEDTAEPREFTHVQLERLQRAMRLQADLELNYAGAALALDLLEKIERLERDLALLKR